MLIPDDAKKGEKIVPVKCKPTLTLQKKDDAPDGGAKGQGSSSRSNKDGKQLQTGGSYPQSTSRRDLQVQSSQRMTDADVAIQTFLKMNVDANLQDLIAEEERLAQEHKENLASGKVKSLEKNTRPKQKGIVIKENESSQSLTSKKAPTVADSKDKGKAKIGEASRSTSDKAHVDAQERKSTSDIAHVEKQKQTFTTSDKAQVVQTKPVSKPLPGFIRPTTTAQEVEVSKNPPIDLNIRSKTARDRSGLGHHMEKHYYSNTRDPSSLSVPGKGMTQEQLDQLESVQMVYSVFLKKSVLLYFMKDGRVYRVKEEDIALKVWEELEYVLSLLKIKNKFTFDAANYIRIDMLKKKAFNKSKDPYVPKYRAHDGKMVEMKKDSARLVTIAGEKVLEFNVESDKGFIIRLGNEMKRNSISDLRAAIYQTGEDDPELKKIKEQMIAELEKAEEKLLEDYLKTTFELSKKSVSVSSSVSSK